MVLLPPPSLPAPARPAKDHFLPQLVGNGEQDDACSWLILLAFNFASRLLPPLLPPTAPRLMPRAPPSKKRPPPALRAGIRKRETLLRQSSARTEQQRLHTVSSAPPAPEIYPLLRVSAPHLIAPRRPPPRSAADTAPTTQQSSRPPPPLPPRRSSGGTPMPPRRPRAAREPAPPRPPPRPRRPPPAAPL